MLIWISHNTAKQKQEGHSQEEADSEATHPKGVQLRGKGTWLVLKFSMKRL